MENIKLNIQRFAIVVWEVLFYDANWSSRYRLSGTNNRNYQVDTVMDCPTEWLQDNYDFVGWTAATDLSINTGNGVIIPPGITYAEAYELINGEPYVEGEVTWKFYAQWVPKTSNSHIYQITGLSNSNTDGITHQLQIFDTDTFLDQIETPGTYTFYTYVSLTGGDQGWGTWTISLNGIQISDTSHSGIQACTYDETFESYSIGTVDSQGNEELGIYYYYLYDSDRGINYGTDTLTVVVTGPELDEETKFNGNDINKIYYNGTEVNLVYFNNNIIHRKPFNVTYNANGGSGTIPTSQIKKYDKVLTLASNNLTKANSTISRTIIFNANNGTTTKASEDSTTTITYTANGWNTNSSGTGISYADGSNYSNNAILDLYANFSSSTGTYSSITFPTTAQCTRTNYTLLGWADSSTATSATYEPGASAVVSGTWYAVWEKVKQPGFLLRDKAATASTWNENVYSTANKMLSALATVKTNYGSTKFDIEIEYVD